LLNDFFWSVFTKEDNTDAPDNCFDEDQEDRLLDIVIEPEYIEAKLRNLQGRLLHINDGANAPWKK